MTTTDKTVSGPPTTSYNARDLEREARSACCGRGRYVSWSLRVRDKTTPVLVVTYLRRCDGERLHTEVLL